MKKIILLIFSMSATMMLQALSVVSTAGGLSTAIENAGGTLNLVTNLTVTGVIDQRDFATIKSSMPDLKSVDLSGASISSYLSYSENEVPAEAFYHCLNIESIIIPTSATSLGNSAFRDCRSLTSITIPSSITLIGNSTFRDCINLYNIHIPAAVFFIGEYAFRGCNSLLSLTIDQANENYSVDNGVLYNKNQSILIFCPTYKTGDYSIPSTVNKIENSAFLDCSSLTSIIIPTSVESIGMSSFRNCGGLTQIYIPSSVTSIGSHSFYDCPSLISVDMENQNYSSIDGVLFDKTHSLLKFCPPVKSGSYTIPSTVTSIEENAFRNCTLLTSVSIPNTVTSLGVGAFQNCSGLASIYAHNPTVVDLTSSFYVFWSIDTTACVLHVPVGSKVLYESANEWEKFVNIVEDLPNAVNNRNISSVKVFTQNNQAILIGLEIGQLITIYNLNGVIIYSQKVNEEKISVDLPSHGVYLLKINMKTIKVLN